MKWLFECMEGGVFIQEIEGAPPPFLYLENREFFRIQQRISLRPERLVLYREVPTRSAFNNHRDWENKLQEVLGRRRFPLGNDTAVDRL